MHTIIHSLILAYQTVKEAGRSQGERAWQSGPGNDNAGIKARGGGSRGDGAGAVGERAIWRGLGLGCAHLERTRRPAKNGCK